MKNLTQRQKEILNFISDFQRVHGFSPTYREIADHFGMASKFGVMRHINALIQKGVLEKQDGTARSLRILANGSTAHLPENDETVTLPLLGRVAAGGPILSGEQTEEWLTLPVHLAKNERDYFTVRVQGDSMTGAGIFDGDIVIVKRNTSPVPGSIVVALVGGEVTVKRLIRQNGQTFLQAENPDYPDIHPEEEWRIQGEVTSLIRNRVM